MLKRFFGVLLLLAAAATGHATSRLEPLGDLCAGNCSSVETTRPRQIAATSRGVFFVGYDKEAGSELWLTDGTPGGTRRVADLNPGFADSDIDLLTVVGDVVYFAATVAAPQPALRRRELWVSDGTAAGTRRIDVPGEPDLAPLVYLTPVGSELWFVGSGALWRTDGTSAGTRKVYAGSPPYSPSDRLGVSRGYVYFTTQGCPYCSPAIAGKFLRADLAGTVEELPLVAGVPQYFDGTAGLFIANDNGLWLSAPPAPVQLIRQFGTTAPDGLSLGSAFEQDGRVYFIASPQGGEYQVWSTDGTGSGTRAETRMPRSQLTGGSHRLTSLSGTTYFIANILYQPQLRALDPTALDGTRNVMEFATNATVSIYGYDVPLPVNGNRLYVPITLPETGDRMLWSSDGTRAGTAVVPLDALVPGFVPGALWGAHSGWLYLSGLRPGEGFEPWRFAEEPSVPDPTKVGVVEYYHPGLDHYFITWRPAEIAELDAGTTLKGWARTGYSLQTYTAPHPGTSPVCRYYLPPLYGDSHFFGRGTVECTATGQANPGFVLEDPAFMHMFLPVGGECPAATVPLYRVFSNRPDANHRYTKERAVRNAMVAQGWLAEGDGPDLVVMCAP